MLTKKIFFRQFNLKKKNSKILNICEALKKQIKKKPDPLFLSLSKKYKYSFNKKKIKSFRSYKNFRIFGMGGSSLGAEAIYSFLGNKIDKKFFFVDNLKQKNLFFEDKKIFNIIISKSGNTLETIANINFSRVKKNCIFITENKNNYLRTLAHNLKSEIVNHNNFIGGRYSVLSETGMLPAILMGLNPNKFKQLDNLIRNKKFFEILASNVGSILSFHNSGKKNSIILNYDDSSNELFKWYQQLVAESLGKKSKGILPIISSMPKDNHSLMQLYLDGSKNNFFTFFYSKDNMIKKISNDILLDDFNYLKGKDFNEILFSKFKATQNIFIKNKIPFRSFIIEKRNEQTLGELFTFFILETILLGRALKIDPFNQPAVELIKKETKRILRNI
mgnify:CR=1 FL=1